MEIVTLIENTSRDPNLVSEHGLSLFITTQGRTLLFDMGASDKFRHNASTLGVDLERVETAFVSHAHYDHGGGLEHFLSANESAAVYLKNGADGDYYANIGAKLPSWLLRTLYPLVKHSPQFSRYIGLNKSVFQHHADRLRLVAGDYQIDESISILSVGDGELPLPPGNQFLLEKSGGRLTPDSFAHELVLVVKEADGLVVITGCGHNGILNILSTVTKAFPGQPVKAVVGGFHLAFQPGKPHIAGKVEDIAHIGNQLLKNGVGKIYTGHCTGDEAYAILQSVLGDKLGSLYTGAKLRI